MCVMSNFHNIGVGTGGETGGGALAASLFLKRGPGPITFALVIPLPTM